MTGRTPPAPAPAPDPGPGPTGQGRCTPPIISLPVWLPAEGVRMVRCGVHFDAVRMPRLDGEQVLAMLGNETGPVIESYPDMRMVWLVPPDSVCSRSPAYHVYGEGCRIEVPPAEPDADLWLTWRIPPSGDCLTDPEALRRALDAVFPPATGGAR